MHPPFTPSEILENCLAGIVRHYYHGLDDQSRDWFWYHVRAIIELRMP